MITQINYNKVYIIQYEVLNMFDSPLVEHVAAMQRLQTLLIHAAGLWRHSEIETLRTAFNNVCYNISIK